MTVLISALILFIVTCNLNSSTGYKWVTVKQGNKLPNNTIRLGYKNFYVGRVILYNTVQPANVVNSSYATVFNEYTNTNDKIINRQFEVLTATESCEWKSFRAISSISSNTVRVGSAWDGEPTYLGQTKDSTLSILMTSRKIIPFRLDTEALVCATNFTWVDATPSNIPKNAISLRDKERFVARLMGPLSFIPAYISNYSNYCSTNFNRTEIKSLTCQVLIGTSKEYSWQLPKKFERIPDYAVVVGHNDKDEFIYVGRDDFHDLQLVTFSSLMKDPVVDFEILVKNVD